MPPRFTIVLVLSFVCLAVPAWADGQAGVDAYKRGDHATALREWRPLAEQGDADAQFYIGTLYAFGRGVPQDYATARQWFEKAAAQGDVKAQSNLGTLYRDGQGVPQDYAMARQWYEQAAAQGLADAQTSLGMLYEEGLGVPQDNVRTYMWYSLAAAHSTGASLKLAAGRRDEVAGRMTPGQTGEAKKLAQKWNPKTP